MRLFLASYLHPDLVTYLTGRILYIDDAAVEMREAPFAQEELKTVGEAAEVLVPVTVSQMALADFRKELELADCVYVASGETFRLLHALKSTGADQLLVEARKAAGRATLFVIDDLADSFDYKNKYAIIQYLKEIVNYSDFKIILLTHNFDFFRTVVNRNVAGYGQCFMAQKDAGRIVLNKADHVNNPFINLFKRHFFTCGMQRIASIPFVRNILEYTKGKTDEDYKVLTSLLHWKTDSPSITNRDLDRIFADTFHGQDEESWGSPEDRVMDLLNQQAEEAVSAKEGVNFENKIVLSIATRILAEKYMITELNDPQFVERITRNQTAELFREFKNRELGTPESQKILEGVSLMTPESIHVNAFMYEPIIDMSDTALRKLYRQAKKLESQPWGCPQIVDT